MTEPLAKVLLGVTPGFKVRGQVYMLVDFAVRHPGGRARLGGVAQAFVLHPQKLMRAIASQDRRVRAINGPVLEDLFAEYGTPERLADQGPYSFEQKRTDLLDQTTVRNFDDKREVEPRYYDWSLPVGATVAVPLSAGMVDVIDRSRRWAAIATNVAEFEKKLNALADRVIELRRALADLCAIGRHGLHEVGMLVGLSQYCDLLLDQEGNPLPGDDPLADFQQFLQLSAIPVFMEKIVRNPVDLAPEAASRRDTHALHLMRALDDPALNEGAKTVVENHDIVPHELFDRMYHYFTAASDLLALTDKSSEFAERHGLPLVAGIAALENAEYESSIGKLEDAGLGDAVRGWRSALNHRDTIYKTLIGISSGIIGSASNLEGPRSIAVAVMMQAQAHWFLRDVSKFRHSTVALDRCMANFIRYFGDIDFRAGERLRHHVYDAVAAGKKINLAEIMNKANIKVTRGPFRGRGTRSFVYMLGLSVGALAAAVAIDDEERSYLALGSALGTAGIATIDFPPIAERLERRWAQQVPKFAGRLAGAVTVLGLVSGALATKDAWEKGESWGVAEGLLGAAGSAGSLGGWIWAARAGAFAIGPSLLMTAGSVLIVLGIGVGLWRTFAVTEPRDLVNATLDYFRDDTSRASIAGLVPTVETLTELADKAGFRPLGPAYEDSLKALGYPQETIDVFRGLA